MFYAVDATGALLHAFTTETDVTADLVPSTNGTFLFGALTALECGARLVESDVGPMDLR